VLGVDERPVGGITLSCEYHLVEDQRRFSLFLGLGMRFQLNDPSRAVLMPVYSLYRGLELNLAVNAPLARVLGQVRVGLAAGIYRASPPSAIRLSAYSYAPIVWFASSPG